MPLMFQLGISFTDAYFEAMSGLTTTGSTVLANLDTLPQSINLWRGMMVWLGGMGLIVLAVAILPLLGIGGRQMFKAETPGPMKDSQLTPRMTQTAKGLWGVYAVVTVLCILSLRWAGMTWFDAVMHSFSTMGLGGFSSHDASFGFWNSPAIEAVTVVFMLLAGMNFATMFLALYGRSFQPYLRDPEARWFLGVTLGSVLGIAIYLWAMGTYPEFLTALRHSAFNVVSIATTTGFASVDYNLWPMFAPLWMLFLCSFATSAGSTGGGIKMIRAIILYKQVYRELMRSMHPNVVWPVRIGGDPVPQNILFAVLAFAFVYMCSIATMTLLLSFSGLEIVTAFSAVVASINNTGPGLNQVGPATTYEVLTDFQTWVCSFAMLLGRLEIFTLLVVLTPAFWRR
jgi:trk system potassium uptake protein TrkH